MLPIQARSEPLMYKMAMLSGTLPNVEPSNHAQLLKQMELHQKLGDFSKIRERTQAIHARAHEERTHRQNQYMQMLSEKLR